MEEGDRMKKYLSIVLIFAIVASCVCIHNAFAQNNPNTITADATVKGDRVIISGITSSVSVEHITMLVTQYGLDSITDENIIAIDQQKVGKNGKYCFSFKMPDNADFGTYIAKVGGSGISVPVTVPFAYKPNSVELETVVKVTDAENTVHEYLYNYDGTSVSVGVSGTIEFINSTFDEGPVFAGWYYDKEMTFPITNGASVEAGEVLYSKYIGLQDNIKMENTEIRTTGTQALRFIARISTDFRSKMIALHIDNYAFDPSNESFNSSSGISYGFLLLPKKFLGEQPMIKGQVYRYGNRSYAPSVAAAKNTYATEPGYEWFTAALTSVQVANYKQEYAARPYMTYKDVSGIERTIHGPTTVSTMYDTAKRIIEENTESAEVIEYLQTNIIDAYDAYISGQASSASIATASMTVNGVTDTFDNDIQDSFEPLDYTVREFAAHSSSSNNTDTDEANVLYTTPEISLQNESTETSETLGDDSSYMINRINFADETGNTKDKPIANGKVSSVSITRKDNEAPAGVVIVSSTQKGELKHIKSTTMSESSLNVAVDYSIDLKFEDEYEGLAVTALVWENYETIRPLAGSVSEKHGSSVHVSAIENSDYIFTVKDSGVSNFNDIVYSVEFDPSVLNLVDCIANTPAIESNVGTYGNITIIEIGEGFVKFKSNTAIPEGKKWSGVVNRLKFEAVDESDTYINVNK